MIEDKSKVEYMDFNALSKEKQGISAMKDSSLHTNPLLDKLFKFVHTKITKFKPEDLL